MVTRLLFKRRAQLTFGLRRMMEAQTKKPEPPSPVKDIIKQPTTKRPYRVSIEGNIGAGKSTLIQFIKDIKGIETYGEPIGWWRDVNGHNLLDLLYSNIQEWLKVFQNYVQLSRLKIQTSSPKSPDTTVQVFERSLQNNRFCFVELARKNGYLSEPDYAVLNEWYKWIEANTDIDLDLIVYLRSTPEVVYRRIQERGRPEESDLSLEYLKQLHESHEDWLMPNDLKLNTIPVIVLDADKTLEEIYEQYKQNESKILCR